MNIFNKIFTILTLIIGLITGILAFLFPQTALAAVNGLAASFHTSYFPGSEGLARVLARAPLAIALVAVIVSVLFLEFQAPRSNTIEVARATGGKLRVTTSSVESKILQAVNAMPDVLSSRVRVATRGTAITAHIEAVTPDTIDILAKGDEIAGGVRSVVQEQLGLKMQDKPHVVIKPTRVKARPNSGGPLTRFGKRNDQSSAGMGRK